MGIAPTQFQLQRRLDRAQELLCSEQLSMTAVAEACGFCDPYHFSRMFKKHRGMSPSAYRQHNGLSLRMKEM